MKPGPTFGSSVAEKLSSCACAISKAGSVKVALDPFHPGFASGALFSKVLSGLAAPRCHTGPLDLVLVIDSSRSVRPFEFETMRQFLVGLLRGLDVGPNATRVGVIQYSSQVQSVFPLGAFSRVEDMERAIRALVPLAQGTMTGLAIQYAMNVAFSVAEGARPPEARVPRIAVIVTDGRPQDRVADVAAQARARGIEIYAVGVQRADVASLRAMASPPLDEHVFLVESFDLIQQFGLQLQSRLCGELGMVMVSPILSWISLL